MADDTKSASDAAGSGREAEHRYVRKPRMTLRVYRAWPDGRTEEVLRTSTAAGPSWEAR